MFWMPVVIVSEPAFCSAPVTASRRIQRTNVEPSGFFSNVTEMWYIVPNSYGPIVWSMTISFVFFDAARSVVTSVPCDQVSVK